MDDAPAAAAAASAPTAAWPAEDATAVSSSCTAGPRSFEPGLPPGYHFLPTHDELIVHYLRPRLAEQQLPLPIFFDERVLDYHPDRLIEKYREYGDDRWFFFAKRERKHEGGSRPNRTTSDNGHWNATGSPKLVRSGGKLVGRVRTLVFYEAPRRKKKQSHGEEAGRLPPPEEEGNAKGVKTDWTMYEYESFTSEEELVATSVHGNAKMDVIVLCTIQKKKQQKKEGERKKRKAREKTDVVAQGSRAAGGNKKPRKKRNEAPPPVDEQVPNLVDNNFNVVVDPNANMSHCFSNASPPPVTPMPPQESAAASGDSHQISGVHPSTAMQHHHGYSNHHHAMMISQFQQAPPPPSSQAFFSPIRWTTMDDGHLASESGTPPPGGMLLQNTIMVAAAPPPEARRSCSFGPGFSSSGYGFTGDGRRRLSTAAGIGDDVSSFPLLPRQPSYASTSSTQEALLHNRVRVNLERFAPTVVGGEEWWPRFSAQGSSKET